MKRRSCTRNDDDVFCNALPGLEAGIDLLAHLRPYVRHCGNSRRTAWHMGPRRLLDYLLVYIGSGKGRFVVAGHAYEAIPGDLFWVPPDTVHEMEGFAPGMHCPYAHFDLVYRPEYSHWDFSIPGGMLDLDDLRPLLHPPLAEPRLQALTGRIRGPTNQRVGTLLIELCAEAARAQPFAGLRMSGLMVEIVAEILRGKEGLPMESMARIPPIEATAEQLVRKCANPPPLSTLARSCELSPGHYRNLFRQHYGCSPRTYVRRARLRKARELMVGTPLTLSEIAREVGFETVHSFSRAFRAEEGLSPTQYRRCAPARTRVEGRSDPYAR
jgi:AraC-like DNA-binding protein